MFSTVQNVMERFKERKYICSRQIGSVVFLAGKMRKPVLVEGPAGVGKTDLGKVLAEVVGIDLIRLQCYEGLDEAKALYEWEYAKQLLYTQILKEKIGEILKGTKGLKESIRQIAAQDDVFFSEKFLLPRPLLRAITSEQQVVLLIDEIDKADPEFEAFLLEVLSDFQVSVPEIGTFKAKHIPLVILTSNNTRELTDALKRRCLHLYIDFPTENDEVEIVRLKVPEVRDVLSRQLVSFIHGLRSLDIKKVPSISETLDWARALVVLNINRLDEKSVLDTLNLILKYEGDIKKAKENLARLMSRIPKPEEDPGRQPEGTIH